MVNNLFRPFFLVLLVLILLSRFAPRIDLKEIASHEGSFLHHNSHASFHTTRQGIDSLQSIKMYCMVSVLPYSRYMLLFSKFDMFLQYMLILYLLWRHFQRKFLMFFGISQLCIDFQSCGGVGVASHRSFTECQTAVMLSRREVLRCVMFLDVE